MAIGINDIIQKFGTQDQIDDTSTSAISNDTLSEVCTWTNTDDSPYAQIALEIQWTTTPPTDNVGIIDVYGRPLNMVATTEEPNAPVASTYPQTFLTSIGLNWAVAATTAHWLISPIFLLPNSKTGQEWEFYFFNNGSGQAITAGWEAWITPISYGPKAA